MIHTSDSWEYETVELPLISIPARCPSADEQPHAADRQSHGDDLLTDLATSEHPVEGVCRRVITRYGFAPAGLAQLTWFTGSFSRALQLLVWVLRAHWFLKMSYVPDSAAKVDGMVDDATLWKAHARATAALAWLLEHVADEPRFSVEAILSRFRREIAGVTDFPVPATKRDLEALVAAARLIAATLADTGRFWHRHTSGVASQSWEVHAHG